MPFLTAYILNQSYIITTQTSASKMRGQGPRITNTGARITRAHRVGYIFLPSHRLKASRLENDY